jgi:ketosteroid isomerase-like protein
MKTNIFIVVLLLFIFGCTSQQSDQLTQQQKDQIKSEIKATGDSIMARLQRMDVNGALQYYSPDFVCFGSDGKQDDFQGYKKFCVETFNSATAYKWTSYRQDFIVITKDTVVFTWDGKNELIMKSGDTMKVDPAHYTFACKKISDQWKLTYHHFSGTFLAQKAEQK